MFCESCGTKNKENAKYCENCGASLDIPLYGEGIGSGVQALSQGGLFYARLGIVIGVFGLILFFYLFPAIVAIILGYTGYKRGEKNTGIIAMILGVVGILVNIFMTARMFL